MANEITITTRVTVRNGNYQYDSLVASRQFDQTNPAGGNPGMVEIGTTEEDVNFGDLTQPFIVELQNQDSTNSVDFGAKDGTGAMIAIGTLPPEGVALFPMKAGATLRMKANTAACKVLIRAQDA